MTLSSINIPQVYVSFTPEPGQPISFPGPGVHGISKNKNVEYVVSDIQPGQYKAEVGFSAYPCADKGVLAKLDVDLQDGKHTIELPEEYGVIIGDTILAVYGESNSFRQCWREWIYSPRESCALPGGRYTVFSMEYYFSGRVYEHLNVPAGKEIVIPKGRPVQLAIIYGRIRLKNKSRFPDRIEAISEEGVVYQPNYKLLWDEDGINIVDVDEDGENEFLGHDGETYNFFFCWPGEWNVRLLCGPDVLAECKVTIKYAGAVRCDLICK